MKAIVTCLITLLLTISSISIYAEEEKTAAIGQEKAGPFKLNRYIFSIGPTFIFMNNRPDHGYAYGYALWGKNFLGKTNFFYGIANYGGTFPSRGDGYFEFAPLIGYRADQLHHVSFDFRLEVNLGSQYVMRNKLQSKINGGNPVLMGALIGVSPIIEFSFPSMYNYDIGISFIPVLKLGSKKIFQRSYCVVALTLNFKSRSLVKKQKWSEETTQGGPHDTN